MPKLHTLHSMNTASQSQVCVTLESGALPVQGTLNFQVCDEQYDQDINVPANWQGQICQAHNANGSCWITVRLVGNDVDIRKAKLLNLDIPEDYGDGGS